MSDLKGFRKILHIVTGGSYSDKHNTDLENGIEDGFGVMLGATSAVVVMLLLFFILRSVIFAL